MESERVDVEVRSQNNGLIH